jgi:secreted Zn-dependent insulinase-like peptidase
MEYDSFNVIKTEYETRHIEGILLKNNIKIVLISDEKSIKSYCSVGVGVGCYHDKFEGTAHFLEHLLFLGNEKFQETNTLQKYLTESGGFSNAYTDDNKTIYYFETEHNFLEHGIEQMSNFFIKPLLLQKHIDTEKKIINSEHEKNINNNFWIIQHLMLKFIQNKEYNKFGTGNIKTLKNIKDSDIKEFFNTFYSSNNLYVCIVDNIGIDEMKQKYLKYFDNIPKTKNDNTIKTEIKLIKDNCIIFKMDTSHYYLTYCVFLDYIYKSQNYFQIINFIEYLCISKYKNSIFFYLFNDIEDIYTTTKFLFKNSLLQINITLENDKNIMKIINCLNEFFEYLKTITQEDFIKIYENYKLLNDIQIYCDENVSNYNTCNKIIENLIEGNRKICLTRENTVFEYENTIYNMFKNCVNNAQIKIITNIDIEKKNSKMKKDSHYNVYYKICNIELSNKNMFEFNSLNILLKHKHEFHFKQTDLYENTLTPKKYKKDNYWLDKNKYGKKITAISIIRNNTNLAFYKNSYLFQIYITIFNWIFMFDLETFYQFNVYCSIYNNGEYYCIDFMGYDEIIESLIDFVIKNLNEDIFNDINFSKYFLKIKNTILKKLKNTVMTEPYNVVSDIFYCVLENVDIKEIVNYIENLNEDDLIKNFNNFFGYDSEKIITVGKNFYNFKNKKIPIQKYVDISLNTEFQYKIPKSLVNSNEKNNCIYYFYLFEYTTENLLKISLTSSIISNLLNNLLYDDLRTKQNLGYIVRCITNSIRIKKKLLIYLTYIIQSEKSVETIDKKVKTFNKELLINIENLDFKTKFENAKKSKLITYSKKPINLNSEINFYKNSLMFYENGNFDFNIKYNTLKNISFEYFNEYFLKTMKKNPSKIVYES